MVWFENVSSDKPSLLHLDGAQATIYITMNVLASVIGTVGNLALIVILVVNKNFQRVGREFLLNLTISDLTVTAFASPLCIIGAVKGEAYFATVPYFCEIVAAMCLTSCFTTFVSLLFFTISRTFFIRSRHRYLDFATKPRLIALCLICWVIGLTLEAPNIFGWGHTFDQKSHSCMWDRTGNYKYTLFISIGCIGAPLVAMAVCHVLTFKHIRDAKLMVYNHSLMKTWKETVKSSRILLIFFAAFAICWIPYTLVIAIDPLDELPMEVHLWVTFLAHTHSTLHPIILIFTNKRMRKFFNFKNRVSPVEMDVKNTCFRHHLALKEMEMM